MSLKVSGVDFRASLNASGRLTRRCRSDGGTESFEGLLPTRRRPKNTSVASCLRVLRVYRPEAFVSGRGDRALLSPRQNTTLNGHSNFPDVRHLPHCHWVIMVIQYYTDNRKGLKVDFEKTAKKNELSKFRTLRQIDSED